MGNDCAFEEPFYKANMEEKGNNPLIQCIHGVPLGIRCEACSRSIYKDGIDFTVLFQIMHETLGITPLDGEMTDFIEALESAGFKIKRIDDE